MRVRTVRRRFLVLLALFSILIIFVATSPAYSQVNAYAAERSVSVVAGCCDFENVSTDSLEAFTELISVSVPGAPCFIGEGTAHNAFAEAFQGTHIDSLRFWGLVKAEVSLSSSDCEGEGGNHAAASSHLRIFFQTLSEYEWALAGTLLNATIAVGGVVISDDGPFSDVRIRSGDFYILNITLDAFLDGSVYPDQQIRKCVFTLSFNPVNQTGVEETSGVPAVYKLENARPNPFNPRTTITFALPESGPVTLQIFDLRGRLVKSLVQDEWKGPGRYPVTWNGRDDAGRAVSSGVYLYRLRSGNYQSTKRLVLLR